MSRFFLGVYSLFVLFSSFLLLLNRYFASQSIFCIQTVYKFIYSYFIANFFFCVPLFGIEFSLSPKFGRFGLLLELFKIQINRSDMIAISLLVVLLVAGLVKYVLHMSRMESYVKHLEIKPPVYPFFGNSLSIIGKSASELFKELVETIKLYGTPMKAYLGPFLVVTVDKPEDIKTVLMSQNCLDKPYFYQFYPSPIGLFTTTCK